MLNKKIPIYISAIIIAIVTISASAILGVEVYTEKQSADNETKELKYIQLVKNSNQTNSSIDLQKQATITQNTPDDVIDFDSTDIEELSKDWKTYKNVDYGFTFQYPSDLDNKRT